MISIVRCITAGVEHVEAYCRERLLRNMPADAQLVEIRQSPDIELNGQNALINTISGLLQCHYSRVFLCEFDCLYHRSYFARDLQLHVLNYAYPTAILQKHKYLLRGMPYALSTLAGHRDLIRNALLRKLQNPVPVGDQRKWQLEPGPWDGQDLVAQELDVPVLEIRHDRNMSGRKQARRHTHRVRHWPVATLLAHELWSLKQCISTITSRNSGHDPMNSETTPVHRNTSNISAGSSTG